MMQLELFPEPEIDYKQAFLDLENKFRKLEHEWEKTRRSLYARQGEIMRIVSENSHELQIIKLNICKGKLL